MPDEVDEMIEFSLFVAEFDRRERAKVPRPWKQPWFSPAARRGLGEFSPPMKRPAYCPRPPRKRQLARIYVVHVLYSTDGDYPRKEYRIKGAKRRKARR